jgi:hypothetical protein
MAVAPLYLLFGVGFGRLVHRQTVVCFPLRFITGLEA